MRRSHHHLAAAGVAAAAALALVGCAESGGSDDPGQSGDGGGDAGTVRYISYWTEGEPTADILSAAFEAFEEETGITVDVQWQGRDLPDVLTPLLSSSDPGVDLFDLSCGTLYNRFYSTGSAADLSGALDLEVPGEGATVRDVIAPDTLARGQDGDVTFCVPYEATSNFDIWYNAAEHPELVDSPPTTWDEFEELLDETGPGSIALDGTIPSYAAAYFTNFALSGVGPGGLAAAANDETGEAFRAPEFVAAAEAVGRLVDEGRFIDGYTASKFPALQQKWANNDADFILNGSWLPAEVEPYAAEGFEYASFPFPAIEEGAHRPVQNGAIGFGLLESSPNAENAERLVAFLLQKQYQDEIGQIAVPARGDASTADSLVGVLDALTDETVTRFYSDDNIGVEVGPTWVSDVLQPLAQQLALGEVEPDQFIDQLVEASSGWWDQQG